MWAVSALWVLGLAVLLVAVFVTDRSPDTASLLKTVEAAVSSAPRVVKVSPPVVVAANPTPTPVAEVRSRVVADDTFDEPGSSTVPLDNHVSDGGLPWSLSGLVGWPALVVQQGAGYATYSSTPSSCNALPLLPYAAGEDTLHFEFILWLPSTTEGEQTWVAGLLTGVGQGVILGLRNNKPENSRTLWVQEAAGFLPLAVLKADTQSPGTLPEDSLMLVKGSLTPQGLLTVECTEGGLSVQTAVPVDTAPYDTLALSVLPADDASSAGCFQVHRVYLTS